MRVLFVGVYDGVMVVGKNMLFMILFFVLLRSRMGLLIGEEFVEKYK